MKEFWNTITIYKRYAMNTYKHMLHLYNFKILK